mmetsp:Transcript_11549/g.23690  ORF Transcript_11549/g.23690 Transcript_11549/m.23690 type:complete len:394 (-) Transcript_11549:30-1211(-)
MSTAPDPRVTHCGEMKIDSIPTDLHSMRQSDPELDLRAYVIQRRAAVESEEQLRTQLSKDALLQLKGRKILVTGASGYLGASLCALMRNLECEVVGLDVQPPCNKTQVLLGRVNVEIGSASDSSAIENAVGDGGGDIVFHAAAWHAPYATHRTEEEFRNSNVCSVAPVLNTPGVKAVVVTSTTSHTITKDVKRREEEGECVWITEAAGGEDDFPPRNKYGRTKREAERLFMSGAATTDDDKPAVVILRAPRFFCEEQRESSSLPLPNDMANELLGRRAALADILSAHVLAALRAPELKKSRIFTLCAPFPEILLRKGRGTKIGSAAEVGKSVAAAFGKDAYAGAPGWRLPEAVTRVYDSSTAIDVLKWQPQYNFESILERLRVGDPVALMGLY